MSLGLDYSARLSVKKGESCDLSLSGSGATSSRSNPKGMCFADKDGESFTASTFEGIAQELDVKTGSSAATVILAGKGYTLYKRDENGTITAEYDEKGKLKS